MGSGTGTLSSLPTALTNTEMRALLKANLHNDTTFSDPADLNTFLTLGQQRIVRDWPSGLGRKQATLALSVPGGGGGGGRSYSLASDFYQMCGVFYPTDSTFLQYVPLAEWMETIEAQSSIPSGTPDAYTLSGFSATTLLWQIIFNYIPSGDMTLYYWYYWSPAAVSGSTTNIFAALGFADLLLQAATLYALQRNDPEGHAVALANYEKELGSYRAYSVAQPAYTPVLRPSGDRGFSRLGPHYPVDTW